MTKVILINGPARSGKDTLAEAIIQEWLVKIDDTTYATHKFADIMHTFWESVFCTMLDYEDFVEHVKGSKKSIQNPLIGISYRQGMIALSEELIKPMLGKDFFGRYTAADIDFHAKLRNDEYVAVISDSGFKEEAVCIIEKFGAENVLLIKLYRPGFTFVGDSRNYISLEEFGVETVELENLDKEQFERKGVSIIREFVERQTPPRA